jgi:hypothetical protein
MSGCARACAFVLAAIATGCYQPAPAEGVPCGEGSACPTGQQCDPLTQRCMRMPSVPSDDALVDVAAPLDAPIDAPSNVFVDDFERADAADVGNGWIEKNPPVFSLQGGEVVRILTNPESYRDNMVYRPASEDVLDVEISVRVRITSLPPRYPQIFVRAVSATITTPDSYDGYLLYVVGTVTDRVVLGRQRGGVFVVTLATINLSESFNTTDPFRLTLRAQGTDPVQLAARVERFDGASWIVIGEANVEDAAAERIAGAGTVGFAGDEQPPYVYDDFRRTLL